MNKRSENYCREVYSFDRKIVFVLVFFNICNPTENSFSTMTISIIVRF